MDNHALYTVAQVRAFDRAAIDAHGIAGYVLMQRAAAAAFRFMRARWPEARHVLVLCGSGNNGGDGYVLARLAREAGLVVSVIASGPPRESGDAARAHADWAAAGGQTNVVGASWPAADVIIDALFGTGLKRAPEGAVLTLIEKVNSASRPVLALDVPSGVDADTGFVPGVAIAADATITFVARKRGLHTGAARAHCGDIVCDDLQIPAATFATDQPDARLMDARDSTSCLPHRARDAHKGNFGHVLAI